MKDVAAKVAAVLEPTPRKSAMGFNVTDSAYYNLSAVIFEMKDQKADKVQIRTLEKVAKQIAQVLKICEQKPTT